MPIDHPQWKLALKTWLVHGFVAYVDTNYWIVGLLLVVEYGICDGRWHLLLTFRVLVAIVIKTNWYNIQITICTLIKAN